MIPATIESNRRGEIPAFPVMIDFQRVDDASAIQWKITADAVELYDEKLQVEPLQIETTEVTSVKKPE